MQLSVMRGLLRKRIGNPDTTDVPDTDLTEVLNLAYADIATKFGHHQARTLCTFDTVAEQASYGLPTACGALLKVWDNTNLRRLVKGSDRTLADNPDTTSGEPIRYVRFKNYIQFIPPPDDVYEIEIFYRMNTTDMVDDADTPSMVPATWHIGIVMLARWFWFDGQADIPKAAYALNAYKTWLSDRPTEIDEETRDVDVAIELPVLGGQTQIEDSVSTDDEDDDDD